MNKCVKYTPQNVFIHSLLAVKVVVKRLQNAKFYEILLVSAMLVGIFTPAFSLYNGESGRVVNISLYGSAVGGWGFTLDTITSPGSTIAVNQGDLVNLTLTSADGIKHNFFVDYNGDMSSNPGEPKSADFTTTINYQFTAHTHGSFTYYCQYYKSTMYGTFRAGVVIRNTGQISMTTSVIATSGSARDIQVAVDQVVAAGGIGEVFIPEGTFNFVEVGEPWMTVEIPAGINLFGEPTERDANEQVTEWKTVLVMPYDVPGDWYGVPYWFRIIGAGDPNKPSQFSDIKMVGYRSIDPDSVTVHRGIEIRYVADFRIDHCHLEHICGGAIGIFAQDGGTGTTYITRGVIDHCNLINKHGYVVAMSMENTIGYGIAVGRGYGDLWEDDITKVLGQYTDYSVYIEDCYFEKWRHCVCANSGAHYVIRHSTINKDYGFGSLDAHGWGSWDGTKITQVGTRAIELYNCQMLDPYNPAAPQREVVFLRGGACIAFGNIVTEPYYIFVSAGREADLEVSKCWPHDVYVWNNQLPSGVEPVHAGTNEKGTPEEGVDYFLHQPHTFNYEPYPYPHPLTLETTP